MTPLKSLDNDFKQNVNSPSVIYGTLGALSSFNLGLEINGRQTFDVMG